MNHGRELDALVAEKVFGEKPFKQEPLGYGMDGWVIKKEAVGPGFEGLWPLPAYSTDISAAWQVVEKMREKTGHVEVWGPSYDKGVFLAGFDPKNRDEMCVASTAPHAICLAALKAAGAAVPV